MKGYLCSLGNSCAYAAPHAAYRCRGNDRWCAVAVFTDAEWEAFCQVIGNPAWAVQPRFSTFHTRKENEDELDRLIEGWTIYRSTEEIQDKMQAAGIAAGVVQTAEDLMERDPQLRHRQLFRELEHPEIGQYRAPGHPFILSKVSYDMQRAPLLGEHTDYVLKEILGMPDDEVAELVIQGVVE